MTIETVMTEENTFAVFPQKVFAKDVAVNDYLMIYGIPCWTARIRSASITWWKPGSLWCH